MILELLACPLPASPYSYSVRGIGEHPRSSGVDLDIRLPRTRPAFPASNSVIKIQDCAKIMTRCCFKNRYDLKGLKIPSNFFFLGYCCQVLFDYYKVPSIKDVINLEGVGSKVQ